MTPAVRSAFEGYSNSDAVRYVSYWDDVAAKTDEDVFRRFLFAFMSVHTTWEINVKGYEAIRDYHPGRWTAEALRDALRRSGAGLHNNRARWIGDFGHQYWADPASYRRGVREPWAGYRDRLEQRITGLGPAKVSFALELAFPIDAQVLCLDVHMLRMYGKKGQSMRKNEYERYESDWVGRANAVELPPFVVKQIAWDRQQGKSDSRYWSKVFE